MTSISKPKGAYHHGDLRRALVDAALVEVERAGADSLSLSALAKSLGVSQPAPYRHFADREALLLEVVTEGFRQFVAMLEVAPKRAKGREALSRMAQDYVRFGRDRPHLYQLMFASHLLPKALTGDQLQATASGSFALLVAACPGDTPEIRNRNALRIWVGLHGVVMLANQDLLSDRLSPIDLPGLVEDLLG